MAERLSRAERAAIRASQGKSTRVGNTIVTPTGTRDNTGGGRITSGGSSAGAGVNTTIPAIAFNNPKISVGGVRNYTGQDLTSPRREVATTGYTPIGTNLDKGISLEDSQYLQAMGEGYNMAKAQGNTNLMNYYHNLAEERRQSLGYSGGVDGSQRIPITTGGTNVGSSVLPGEVTPLRTPAALDALYNFQPNQGNLRTVEDLAKNYLGDITFDEDAILSKFQQRTRDEFASKGESLRGVEAQFGRNLFDTGLTARDAIRRANAQAVATGASRGVQAAQELSSILGLEQEATGAATELAQARALLGTQEAEALSQDVVDALTTSNQLKQNIGTLASNLYATDTQFRVGEMDYYANLENTIKNFESVLAQTGATIDVADINRDGQITVAELGAAATRYGADQDRASREYVADRSYESYTDTAKINSAASALRSGSASSQQKEDYAAGLARYVADGNEDAYITTLTSMGVPYDEAVKRWSAASGQLQEINPTETKGWFDKFTDWMKNEVEYVSGVVSDTVGAGADLIQRFQEWDQRDKVPESLWSKLGNVKDAIANSQIGMDLQESIAQIKDRHAALRKANEEKNARLQEAKRKAFIRDYGMTPEEFEELPKTTQLYKMLFGY